MSWTTVFINALKEWDETCTDKRMKIEDACFFLGFPIGQKTPERNMDLRSLEERINYLVNQEGFVEEFLINSLINEMSNHLNREINHLGEAIINNEALTKIYEEKHGEPSPQIKNLVERIKNKPYIYSAEESIDVWNEIIQREFSLSRRRDLRNQELLKSREGMKAFMERVPEEERKKTIGEIFDKYSE